MYFSICEQNNVCHAGSGGSAFEGLTRYSNTSVSDLSVWTISCSVTMLACFRSFSNDTEAKQSRTIPRF